MIQFIQKKVLDVTDDEFKAWDAMCSNDLNCKNPFFSPTFAKTVAITGGDVCATLIYRNQKLIGVFPFEYINRCLGSAIRVGRHLSDHEGIIGDPNLTPNELREMMVHSGISIYSFNHLSPGQKLLRMRNHRVRSGVIIDLDGGFENYWGNLLNRNRRAVRDTERQLKRIESDFGGLRFTFHSAEAGDLTTMMNLKREQFHRTSVEDPLADNRATDLIARLHQHQGVRFRGVLAKLTAGSEMVSLHFGLTANGVLHSWFPVYHTEFSKYSPGRLLLYHLMRDSEVNGIRIIDLGQGLQPYKLNFATAQYELGVGEYVVNGPRAVAIKLRNKIVNYFANR